MNADLKKANSHFINIMSIFAIVSAIAISVLHGDVIADSVRYGMRMCYTSIIPAIFPFFILSDLISTVKLSERNPLARFFGRLFGVSPSAIIAFTAGAVCGFPIGVKIAIDLYSSGRISKTECERIVGMVNNPSLGFIVAGVGSGMRGNTNDGYVLYVSILLSSLITGIIFRNSKEKNTFSCVNSEQKFSIVHSVKSAGASAITVTSFVVFFSCIIGAIESVVPYDAVSLVSAVLLEIGSGASRLSSADIPKVISLPLTALALGFSGCSVHLQAESLMPEELSRKYYYVMKITQSILAFAISCIFIIFSCI